MEHINLYNEYWKEYKDRLEFWLPSEKFGPILKEAEAAVNRIVSKEPTPLFAAFYRNKTPEEFRAISIGGAVHGLRHDIQRAVVYDFCAKVSLEDAIVIARVISESACKISLAGGRITLDDNRFVQAWFGANTEDSTEEVWIAITERGAKPLTLLEDYRDYTVGGK